MTDGAKRLAEDLLQHRHDPEAPYFQAQKALFVHDGHGPGIHTDEGIA